VKPPPFSRQKFTVEDLNPYLSAEDRARFRDMILSARNEGLFTPPSFRGSVQMPGNNGGANWGGAAVDPGRGMLAVASKDLPCILQLKPDPANPKNQPSRYVSSFGFLIANGLSAIAPPWTSLTFYDLNEGIIKWSIPLGEVTELAARGIVNTGAHFPRVGPVITAGGLIITGTNDRKARAFDVENGKMLWEAQLPEPIEGIPAVYEVGGTEYIVFCAAAQARSTARSTATATPAKFRGAYVAFALRSK
jgi:quinoprotein glucose dehydrogenase